MVVSEEDVGRNRFNALIGVFLIFYGAVIGSVIADIFDREWWGSELSAGNAVKFSVIFFVAGLIPVSLYMYGLNLHDGYIKKAIIFFFTFMFATFVFSFAWQIDDGINIILMMIASMISWVWVTVIAFGTVRR